MQVTIVSISVKTEYITAFITACKKNHDQSIQETGNFRFDVLQMADNPCQFVLYESYQNASATTAHKKTTHYLEWRETVADMMAEPRIGVNYNGLYPEQ